MHISLVKDKSAGNLRTTVLDEDWYHDNIKSAAMRLWNKGDGNLVYWGQYSSGVTLWVHPVTLKKVTIAREEKC